MSKVRKGKKINQLNTRVSPVLLEGIDRIATIEERDRSDVVRSFLEWSIEQYDLVSTISPIAVLKLLTTSNVDVKELAAHQAKIGRRVYGQQAPHAGEKIERKTDRPKTA